MSQKNTNISLREKLNVWIESNKVQYFITTVIILNGIILGLETSASMRANYGGGVRCSR